jgi:hypothetical protein
VVRAVVRAAVASVMAAVPVTVVVGLRLRLRGVMDGVANVADGIVGAVLRLRAGRDSNSDDGDGGEEGLGKSVSHGVLQ